MNVYGKEHDVQSHKFSPTITDMQDKSWGAATIFTLFKANIQRWWPLNKVSIVAVTTILLLHVGNGGLNISD